MTPKMCYPYPFNDSSIDTVNELKKMIWHINGDFLMESMELSTVRTSVGNEFHRIRGI